MREERKFGSKYFEPWKQLLDVHIYLSDQSLCVFQIFKLHDHEAILLHPVVKIGIIQRRVVL